MAYLLSDYNISEWFDKPYFQASQDWAGVIWQRRVICIYKI
jgi:hypothetical protein